MTELFAKCMLAPYELDKQGLEVLKMVLLAAIAEAVGLDDEEIYNKAKEVFDKL